MPTEKASKVFGQEGQGPSWRGNEALIQSAWVLGSRSRACRNVIWTLRSFTRPELAISLALRSGGFELGLRNGGRSIAEDVSVEIIGWRQGPPAPEINERHDAKSLIPGEEYTVYPVMKLDAWLQPETFSGHIVATCRRCSEPKAWAFNFGLPVWERNRETAFGQVRMADS